MSDPLVSVIIPCFNGAEYLEECIRSVLDQNTSCEIIVVDDGSTDASAERARSLLQDLPVDMFVLSQRNCGQAAARNAGIRAARGKYLCFLDIDDSYAPGFLATTVSVLEKEPTVIGAFCKIEFVNAHRPIEPWQREAMERTLPCNMLLRTEVVRDLGGFPEHAAFRGRVSGEDGVFRIELRRRGKMVKINKPLFKYRVQRGSHLDFFLDRSYLENERIQFRQLSKEEEDGSLKVATRDYRESVQERFLTRMVELLRTSLVASSEFHRLAQRLDAIEGDLHPAEGFALYSLARRWLVEGATVEIGSLKGRSTCWLAAGCRDSRHDKVVAVSLFHESPNHRQQGSLLDPNSDGNGATLPDFRRNLDQHGLTDWVNVHVGPSAEINKNWQGPIRLLFIDSDGSDLDVGEAFMMWSRFVPPNGLVALHDVGKLPAVTHVYAELCSPGSGWKELLRHGSLGVLQRTGKEANKAAKLEAEAVRLRDILERNPRQTDTLHRLAQVLDGQKKWDEAIVTYRRLLELRPEHADAHNFLGIILARQRMFDEAMEHFRSFNKLEPQRAAGHHNMGVACADGEQVTQAIEHFDDALKLDPQHAEAHKGKGMALLKLGQFREGWAEYEWRWRCKDLPPLRSPRPLWDGSPLDGKTILVHSEQGIGDTLQFVRYAAYVKAQGATVILACPPALIPLLRTCPGIDRLVSRKSPLPPHDVHTPLLSLPRILQTELANIPHDVPFLYAEPARLQAWQKEFANVSAFKIGIVWQGNPKHLNDANRSIPLHQFESLAKIQGIRLYSLQFGKGTEDLKQLSNKFDIVDLGRRIGPFVEVAAAMKNLDLVVCCDTSMAHLAGALGVPVWVALSFAADWRWLQEGEGSPWYPTMRLFRQRHVQDWQEVFERIGAALQIEVQKPRMPMDSGALNLVSDMEYRYAEHPENEEPAPVALPPVTHAADVVNDTPVKTQKLLPAAPQILQAVKLIQVQKYPQAEQILRQFLAEDATNADAWFQLALAQQAQNRLPDAANSLFHALRIRPEHADSHASIGIILCRLKRRREGEAALREAIRLQPNFPKAHNNLGVLLAETGRRTDALACWQETVRLDPNYPEGHFNLAVGLAENKQLDEAAIHYERALQLRPDYAEAYSNLGLLRVEQGRAGEAVILLEHAGRLKPDFVDAHNNLGLALADLGRSEEALACYREALRLRPNNAEVYNNFGTALAAMGRADEALSCFAQALRLKPGYPEARWHQALTWLHEGDLARGWPEYEWRWKRKCSRPRRFKEPLWDGSSLEGKTILIWCEQGLGDSLQFIRYVPLVKACGGTVIVECPEKLMNVFFTCAGIDQLVPEKNKLPSFDVQIPLLSLPGIFGTRLHSVPADVPYLSADPARIEKWRAELDGGTSPRKFRIGIAWQGNPKHRWDRHRSFKLENFQRLARIDGVHLYSLQNGANPDNLAEFVRRHSVLDLGYLDFADTAAIMRNLDLVIACDSSLAHLAGALGVPVWVPLSAMCDWRWLRHRDDSPWYPTLRLFRQKKLGDWDEVFTQIEYEIIKLATKRIAHEI